MDFKIKSTYRVATDRTDYVPLNIEDLVLSLKETFSDWDKRPRRDEVRDEVNDYIYYRDYDELIKVDYDDVVGDVESEIENMEELLDYLINVKKIDRKLSDCC